MDYRNNVENFDSNTIIYAHGRYNKTMFGTLKDILTNNWLKNTNNYVVKLVTEKESSLWQVFSVYHIPTTSDYLSTTIDQTFVNMLMNRSQYNFNTDVSSSDKILTLSTCYSDTEKMVMHAKLIKKILK